MASRIAFVAGVLLLLVGGWLFGGSVSNHTYDLVIVGNASTGYSVQKNTTRFEVDYLRTTTWRVTSTADVDRDFQIDGLSGESKCRIAFSTHDPSYDCKTVRATIGPNQAAVTFTATAKNLRPDEYYEPWWGFPLYSSDVLVGPVGGLMAKADPDLELEREYNFAILLAILAGLISLGASWWLRRRHAA